MKPKDINRLTYAKAASFLFYDPDTGVFIWKRRRRRWGSFTFGEIAGHIGRDGYVTIMIDGHAFKGHRLAWLLHFKRWPKLEMLDHINGIKHDNRIVNLREATRSQNLMGRTWYLPYAKRWLPPGSKLS